MQHYTLPCHVVLRRRQAASHLCSHSSILQKESLTLAFADENNTDWLWTKGFSLNFKAAENFMSNQLEQKAPKSLAESGTNWDAGRCVSILKLSGINVAFQKTSISGSTFPVSFGSLFIWFFSKVKSSAFISSLSQKVVVDLVNISMEEKSRLSRKTSDNDPCCLTTNCFVFLCTNLTRFDTISTAECCRSQHPATFFLLESRFFICRVQTRASEGGSERAN